MFKSKRTTINPNTTDTLVGEGTTFEGNIKSEATLRIEGSITGLIECTGDVIIGEKGVVTCMINARDVIIAGQVRGDIIAKGKIVIVTTGQLHGNITTGSFTIQEGGIFQGNSNMVSDQTIETSGGSHSSPEIIKTVSNL